MAWLPTPPARARGRRVPRLVAGAAGLALLLVLPAAAGDPAVTVLTGRVSRVLDGDSVRVELTSGPIEVRLFGIDAPERDQPHGAGARRALSRLLDNRTVDLEPVAQDRYDRMVAIVYRDRLNVNEAMLRYGHAWAYRSYLGQVTGADGYCELEAAAREARRGLWAGDPATWTAPWEHRAAGRGRGRVREYSGETAAACRAAIPTNGAVPGSDPAAGDCRIKGNINDRGGASTICPGHPTTTAPASIRPGANAGSARRRRPGPPAGGPPGRRRARRSNCLFQVVVAGLSGCHGVWSRAMALSMVRNLRMQAVRASFLALPRATRRW